MPKKNKIYAVLIVKLHKAIQDDNMDLVESMIKADTSLCQSRESVSKGEECLTADEPYTRTIHGQYLVIPFMKKL